MAFRLKNGKYNVLWPICILRYCLPVICFTFFGQFFLLLISVFICRNGKTYYDDNIPCRQNSYFYLCALASIISIIIQLILSYITISMYFIPDFINRGNDLLKKRTSTPELIFFLCKIIIIIIFIFDKENEKEHWGILFILCLVTGSNAYAVLFLQNYENIIIKRFNNFYSLFLFWGFACLFILKIFKSWEFGGGLYLFVLGIVLIFIYSLYYMKTFVDFLKLNYNEMNNSTIFLNYIKAIIQIAKQRQETRDNSIILTSLIEKIEERCTNNKCILKNYLECLSNGFDSNYLLLLFIQKLFKVAINKFPHDTLLRFNYIVFLSTQINQKKNALKELVLIKQSIICLNNNFNLYFCKKYIEEYNSINNVDQEEEDNNDIFQAMEYKSNIKEFKKLLSQASSLYYDFWSSLYSSHLQGTEDFKKLNDLGADLNILIEDIENIFEKLCKIKKDDYAIFKLYESYVKNILNDKDKYEKYYNFSKNLINDNNASNRDIDYTNYDLKIINKTDEYRYLIISANDNNRGIIMNMSLSICETFGYHKDEIIGKNMNILIPDIYHKIHDKLFNDKTDNTKTEFFENLSKKINYKPNTYEFCGFGKNKSRYLIPLDFKIFFIQTEESDLVYVVDIMHRNISNDDLDGYIKGDNNQTYCVLTDNNLILQTFTSNCVEHLGLNSSVICSNYDITNFIKEFNDELATIVTTSNKELSIFEMSEAKSNDNSFRDVNNNSNNNIDEDSFEKLRLKKKLLKTKFFAPRKIIWNNNIKEGEDKKIYSGIGKTQLSLFNPNKKRTSINNSINDYDFNKNNNSKKNFIMSVKKAFISGKHIGYYFFFKKLKLANELENNYLEKNKTLNTPQTKIKEIKRPSIKHFKLDGNLSESNLKTTIDDNSIAHKNSLKLNNGEEKKRHSVNFDLDNVKHLRKHESAKVFIEIDDMLDLDDKYTPKSNFNFVLDLESMSYKPSWKIGSCKILNNELRKKTIEKINLFHQTQKKSKIENSSLSSSEIDNSQNDSNNLSYDYSSSYTSSSQRSSPKNNNISSTNDNNNVFNQRSNKRKASIIETNIFSHLNVNINEDRNNDNFLKKNNIKKNSSNDEYYRINISKIKLMVYDFNQEMIIVSEEKDKKSKVEKVIEEYKAHQNINISEDINFSFISFQKKEVKNKNSKNQKNLKKIKTEEDGQIKKKFDREKEFEQEIKYALSKQDEQKSIHHFYKMSVIFFVIMLLMSIFEIYYINKKYLNLKENMNLILHATNLKYLTNIGIYFIRENTLMNINNHIKDGLFNIPDKNHNFYQDLIMNYTKNTFIECNNILESITSSSLKFCYDTNIILTEPVFEIEELYNENYIKKYNTSLYVLMIQVYSAFCNLITKSEYITVDDRNLYNFIHNAYNSLGNALIKQLELFLNELRVREKNMIISIAKNTFGYLLAHIIVYFLISSSYCLIVKRKASYIEVFYGIGVSLIKTSIKKCEIFINKIHQNDDIEKQRDIEEEDSSYISSSNFNNNYSENNFDKKRVIKRHNKKKRKLGDDKQSIKFKLILKIAMLGSYLYLILIFYLFIYVTKTFIYSGNYIFHMQNYHNNIFELFNGYREFLFDENIVIYGLSSYDYLIEKEKILYSSNSEDKNFLSYNSNKIKGLNQNFFGLLQNGFCYYFESFFDSKEGCENFIGGKNGIISLDFHLLINSFIEEIRNARDFTKLLLDKQVLVGNLSELIKEKDNDSTYGIDKNKTLIFRMKIFNMEETHYRLNIIFFNIIFQYINQIKIITINAIEETITDLHKPYILLILSYVFIFIFIYFFYWIPMIRNLDVEIYKTKNMLSIIPVKILASQPNIKKLLNISYIANE